MRILISSTCMLASACSAAYDEIPVERQVVDFNEMHDTYYKFVKQPSMIWCEPTYQARSTEPLTHSFWYPGVEFLPQIMTEEEVAVVRSSRPHEIVLRGYATFDVEPNKRLRNVETFARIRERDGVRQHTLECSQVIDDFFQNAKPWKDNNDPTKGNLLTRCLEHEDMKGVTGEPTFYLDAEFNVDKTKHRDEYIPGFWLFFGHNEQATNVFVSEFNNRHERSVKVQPTENHPDCIRIKLSVDNTTGFRLPRQSVQTRTLKRSKPSPDCTGVTPKAEDQKVEEDESEFQNCESVRALNAFLNATKHNTALIQKMCPTKSLKLFGKKFKKLTHYQKRMYECVPTENPRQGFLLKWSENDPAFNDDKKALSFAEFNWMKFLKREECVYPDDSDDKVMYIEGMKLKNRQYNPKTYEFECRDRATRDNLCKLLNDVVQEYNRRFRPTPVDVSKE